MKEIKKEARKSTYDLIRRLWSKDLESALSTLSFEILFIQLVCCNKPGTLKTQVLQYGNAHTEKHASLTTNNHPFINESIFSTFSLPELSNIILPSTHSQLNEHIQPLLAFMIAYAQASLKKSEGLRLSSTLQDQLQMLKGKQGALHSVSYNNWLKLIELCIAHDHLILDLIPDTLGNYDRLPPDPMPKTLNYTFTDLPKTQIASQWVEGRIQLSLYSCDYGREHLTRYNNQITFFKILQAKPKSRTFLMWHSPNSSRSNSPQPVTALSFCEDAFGKGDDWTENLAVFEKFISWFQRQETEQPLDSLICIQKPEEYHRLIDLMILSMWQTKLKDKTEPALIKLLKKLHEWDDALHGKGIERKTNKDGCLFMMNGNTSDPEGDAYRSCNKN